MRSFAYLAAVVLATGCVCGAGPDDGGLDAGDASVSDGGGDAGPDAGSDAGLDAGADAGSDAGVDAGTDAGADAGSDAGFDAGVDRDLDGLDDGFEASLAAAYLPTLAVHPQDGCPLGGLIFRARPHPDDGTLVLVQYVFLLQNDCGLGGHVGDDEGFAITVNPALPAPQGLRAIKAISHQGTLCERTSTCGTCNSLDGCDVPDGGGNPTVYFSKDKHGSYAVKRTCDLLSCLDVCAPAARTGVPLVNVGEPTAHLVEDLTDAGFVTAANGWTEASLFHFNPWAPGVSFGTAGVVAEDLIDQSFTPPPCR